jgi:hypothetical protein
MLETLLPHPDIHDVAIPGREGVLTMDQPLQHAPPWMTFGPDPSFAALAPERQY